MLILSYHYIYIFTIILSFFVFYIPLSRYYSPFVQPACSDTQELDDLHLEGLDEVPRAEPSRARGGRTSSRR